MPGSIPRYYSPAESNHRMQALRTNSDTNHPIQTPAECLDLLVNSTQASEYLAKLQITINNITLEYLKEPEVIAYLVRALRYAQELWSIHSNCVTPSFEVIEP